LDTVLNSLACVNISAATIVVDKVEITEINTAHSAFVSNTGHAVGARERDTTRRLASGNAHRRCYALSLLGGAGASCGEEEATATVLDDWDSESAATATEAGAAAATAAATTAGRPGKDGHEIASVACIAGEVCVCKGREESCA